MLQRTGPQLLFLIALCSVLYSRTLSLPYTSMRPTRHADGLFTSGYSKLLGQLSARRYLESLIGKRVSDELMEEPVKRHSDAIFTDNYSRFRKQMAVKKYLNSVLTGKRSLEDPGTSDPDESRDEPSTFQESYNDLNVDQLLNNFQLDHNSPVSPPVLLPSLSPRSGPATLHHHPPRRLEAPTEVGSHHFGWKPPPEEATPPISAGPLIPQDQQQLTEEASPPLGKARSAAPTDMGSHL
ncbi:VIP peptides [Symphorus nematophorus]